jgi:predicted PolB exonuclease-like 3'-5' exonuclease
MDLGTIFRAMLKNKRDHIWAFDLEWIPDIPTGRRVYGLDLSTEDQQVLETMWQEGGATPEKPRPYLKTILCRIISLATVIRSVEGNATKLKLFSLPQDANEILDEPTIIRRFLSGIGKDKPQLVGFNSRNSDFPILFQRALVHSLTAPSFCNRPQKNDKSGVDYFYRYSEDHLDLQELVSGWGKATPSLHEIAQALGIPGKIDTTGSNVIDLWMDGNIGQIVAYNQCDALTTYLVWLRLAYFAGHFTNEKFNYEQDLVKNLLQQKVTTGETHLQKYYDRWQELQSLF